MRGKNLSDSVLCEHRHRHSLGLGRTGACAGLYVLGRTPARPVATARNALFQPLQTKFLEFLFAFFPPLNRINLAGVFEPVAFEERFGAALRTGDKAERERVLRNGESAGDFVFHEFFLDERCGGENLFDVGQEFHLASHATFYIFFILTFLAEIKVINRKRFAEGFFKKLTRRKICINARQVKEI